MRERFTNNRRGERVYRQTDSHAASELAVLDAGLDIRVRRMDEAA